MNNQGSSSRPVASRRRAVSEMIPRPGNSDASKPVVYYIDKSRQHRAMLAEARDAINNDSQKEAMMIYSVLLEEEGLSLPHRVETMQGVAEISTPEKGMAVMKEALALIAAMENEPEINRYTIKGLRDGCHTVKEQLQMLLKAAGQEMVDDEPRPVKATKSESERVQFPKEKNDEYFAW